MHDTVQQHLRALKAMDYDPSGPFITSTLELKLDTTTMFEWQKHSQTSTEVPHNQDLLTFIDLRAQASETSVKGSSNQTGVATFKKGTTSNRAQHTSFVTSTPNETGMNGNCIVCNDGAKHPLYACSKFKVLSHENKLSLLRNSKLCHNCLKPGHFAKTCKSSNYCKVCQKPHHTLLHVEHREDASSQNNPIQSHTASETNNITLLMTCHVLVHSPDGSSIAARAVLDSASSASFVSERLAQTLHLPRSRRVSSVSGIAGLTCKSTLQDVTQFNVSPLINPAKKFNVDAIVMPRVTCDLPISPVNNKRWGYISDLSLADPSFNQPGRIDVLLGVDVFVNTLMQGRRTGPPGCPVALQTEFGWVLAGGMGSPQNNVVHQVTTVSGDDVLKRFWEIEEHHSNNDLTLTPDEKYVVEHFKANHLREEDGSFVVPLPRVPDLPQMGESKSMAVRRYLSLERSLKSKGKIKEFHSVMEEYVQLGHAELVPTPDLQKPDHKSFYLPMHIVLKESSTTTKVRAVFDASVKSLSGVSLNDTLMVGPIVHAPLVDVLLKFRHHRYALTTHVSKMYRAVKLTPSDRDYH